MLIRFATLLAGSAALALTVPAIAADPAPAAAKTTHHVTHHKVTHRKMKHHMTHRAAKHHTMHHAASTKTTTKTAAGTTTAHTVAPKSGKMVKTSTTTHK